MRKLSRNVLITLLLLALMPAIYAFDSTLLIEGGVGIPLDDIAGTNEMKGAWALAWDAWVIKDWIGVGVSPWIANIEVQGEDPGESYFSSLEGINLYLKLRPTKTGALNFSEQAFIRRISPFVAIGGGWSTHGSKDKDGIASNPSTEPGFRGHWTLPHAAAGISVLSSWNTTLDLGVKYDLFTKDNIDLIETGSMNDALLTPYAGLGLHFGSKKVAPVKLGKIDIKAGLTEFSTEVGKPSQSQGYDLIGIDLSESIALKAPEGFEISVDGGKTFGPTAEIPAGFDGRILVRLTGTKAGIYSGHIAHSSKNAATMLLPVTGTVMELVPMIKLGGSLGGFSTEIGTPSAPQSYKLSGLNLSGNTRLTAPEGFEFSLDGGKTWKTSEMVDPKFDGDVWVRLKGDKAGQYAGNIDHASAGAVNLTMPVLGVVAPKVETPVIRLVGKLGGFSTEIGTPSAPQSYKLTGANLTGNTRLTAPEGYEFSLDGGKSWQTSATVDPKFDGDVWVRLKGNKAGDFSGNIDHASVGAANLSLPVMGVVAPKVETPVIRLVGKLGGFSTEIGTPSAPQSYKLSGANLTGNTRLTAPEGYEFSLDGGKSWQTSATVDPKFDGDVWVRLKGNKAGDFSGNIDHASAGAANIILPVVGVVAPKVEIPVIKLGGNLGNFSTELGTPSAPQSYKLSGANLTGNIRLTAPEGFEFSLDGGKTWQTSATVDPKFNGDVWVRLKGDKAGTYGGNLAHNSDGAVVMILPVTGVVSVPKPTGPSPEELLEQDLLAHMVHFDTNLYTIREDDKPFLDRVAEALKNLPDTMIEIQGHTDSKGSNAINEPLSYNRAKVVKDYFVIRGVDEAQLEVKGYSSQKPISTNDTVAGRQENRRAQMVLIK